MKHQTKDAAYWIHKLSLTPHPEGGYYRQTYQASLILTQELLTQKLLTQKLLAREALTSQFSGPRPVSTAIYFLLHGHDFSAFHRLQSDELWHFYYGATLSIHVIEADGRYSRIQLGADPERGDEFQAVVKAGNWFASELKEMQEKEVRKKDRKSLALVGCTVAPGFDFADFELAKREELQRSYPQHRELIGRLTRT